MPRAQGSAQPSRDGPCSLEQPPAAPCLWWLIEHWGLEEPFSLVSRVKNWFMMLSQGTGDGKEISTCLCLWPHHRQGSGRRIPVKAALKEPPSSHFPSQEPPSYSQEVLASAHSYPWDICRGESWVCLLFGAPMNPGTCGKHLIQSCQLPGHHLPPAPWTPSVTTAPRMATQVLFREEF